MCHNLDNVPYILPNLNHTEPMSKSSFSSFININPVPKMARIPAPHLTQNKVQEAERQFNVKVGGVETKVRIAIWRMVGSK